MSVERAKEYFRRSDAPDTTVNDLLVMFADDAVCLDPYVGSYQGIDEIRTFFEDLSEVFVDSVHEIRNYHVDGETVVCEGTLAGKTSASRTFSGVGLVEVMEFNGEDIQALRVYLDYSGIRSNLPDDDEIPDYRRAYEE